MSRFILHNELNWTKTSDRGWYVAVSTMDDNHFTTWSVLSVLLSLASSVEENVKLPNINFHFESSDWSHWHRGSSLLSSLFTSREESQAAALQIWNFVVFAMTDQGGGGGGGNERDVWWEILEKQINPGQTYRGGGEEDLVELDGGWWWWWWRWWWWLTGEGRWAPYWLRQALSTLASPPTVTLTVRRYGWWWEAAGSILSIVVMAGLLPVCISGPGRPDTTNTTSHPPDRWGYQCHHHHHHILSLTTPTSPHPPFLVPQQYLGVLAGVQISSSPGSLRADICQDSNRAHCYFTEQLWGWRWQHNFYPKLS